MAFEWTKPQQDAIDARGGPLLVSAAAGSGKTAVLVQRIIDIITDPDHPVDIDRFLVVTFTKKAAGEMREKIAKELSKLLEKEPYNKRLIEQQLLLPKAQISTIDSFCSAITREYFYLLDLPADLRIIETDEREILRNAALDNVLDEMYEQGNPDFLKLMEAFSGSNDDYTVRSMVLKIHRFLDAQPFPKSWVESKLKNYDVASCSSPWETVWGEVLMEYVLGVLSFIERQSSRAFELAHSVETFDKAQMLIERECGYIERFSELVKSGKWDEIRELFAEMKTYFSDRKASTLSFSGAKTEPNKSISKLIRGCRNAYKPALMNDLEPLFRKTSSEFFEEIDRIRPISVSLLKITLRFIDEYQKVKAERSVADYGDLEHWTLDLLVRETDHGIETTETAREIAKRFDYVMVDEYQDSNDVQDIIFKAVSDEDRRLFVVGDVKQSIYSFRLATPDIFINRKDASTPYDRARPAYPSKVTLDANFRSRKSVTECVNFIFRNVMSRQVGGVDYDDGEKLVAQAPYPEESVPAASFHLLGTGDAKGDDVIAIEARYVAKQIARMMETEVVTEPDGTTRRPVYSDFAILLRSDKDKAVIYSEELLKLGLPSVSEKGGSFFDRPEIRLMLSLLRTLDNPARDVPLAAVLLSPIAGFTVDELALLRAGKKDISLFRLLSKAAKEGDEKCARVKNLFDELRSSGNNIAADELIRRIYNKTMLPEIVLSGEDGEYRRKNLRLLLEYAKTYESSGFKGLSGFVGYMERLAETSASLTSASRSGVETADAVQILSIHRSKGLEYNFCFVSNLGSKFNKMDISDNIVMHGRIGPGTNVVDNEKMYGYKGITRKIIENTMTQSLVSEELRVLYVAMTRAKERLILTASVANTAKTLEKASKELVYDGAIPPYLVMSSSGYLRILLFCMLVSRSGDALREEAGLPAREDGTPSIPIDESDETKWDIKVVPDAAAAVGMGEKDADDDESAEVTDDGITEIEPVSIYTDEEVDAAYEKIADRLGREYSYEEETKIPVKVTASAVAERESGETFAAKSKPSFMKSGELTGADRGTAHHRFAQFCDFTKARLDLAAEKQRLVDTGKLTKEQADCIQDEKVRVFLGSKLMDDMLAAQLLKREYTFMAEIPAGLADKTLEPPFSEAPMILQGSIDCLYELDGELVVVDYKTDSVQTGEELAKRYSRQLELYKYAAEQIFGKKVSRCVLYSFCLGDTVELSLG